MAVYMVGYDLRKKQISQYENLFNAIKSISNDDWWHCLDSTWLIVHPGTADTVWRALHPHIHDAGDKQGGDKLLVVQVVKDAQWSLSFSKECHEWLERKLL